MAGETIKVARSDNYVTLSLNRAEKRNALNQALLNDLDQALTSLENDKDVRALLLRAEGRVFCSGLDLAEVDRLEGEHNPANIQKVFQRLERFPVPTIAAVNGAALAGGLELALHCDLRIAGESAKLGMPLGKVGLMPPFDFTRKLIEVLGTPATNLILFKGDPVSARDALAMGMVNAVVSDAELEQTGKAWAADIAANAPLSLRAIKATIRRCMSAANTAEHSDLDQMARQLRKSQDAREGVRAFLEKRKPVWRAE
ncbi:MAG TPA: enoyl-CoA hydratase/isomerase family protein [Candidatus Binataceae bacterium]|nr:enoyl-CoA hydratase/isomerase family protein [Candidatus Binataceae bacterium]